MSYVCFLTSEVIRVQVDVDDLNNFIIAVDNILATSILSIILVDMHLSRQFSWLTSESVDCNLALTECMPEIALDLMHTELFTVQIL